MGSMNFNIARAGDRVKEWKHAWEKPYLDRTDDHIFRNTFRDIAGIVERMGKGHGTRFEFECYDVGHLYNLAYMLDRKVVEPPLFVQTIFGILGGIGAEPRNLLFMRETADRLFGDALCVVGAGGGAAPDGVHHHGRHHGRQRARRARGQPVYRQAARWRTRTPSRWRRSAASWRNSAWRSPRPNEARQMLKLKGGDRVGF